MCYDYCSEKVLENMGLVLKERRERLGLTQEFVAERLDVSPEYISKLERGKNAPSLAVALGLCNVLNLSISDLFYQYSLSDHSVQELIECCLNMDGKLLRQFQKCAACLARQETVSSSSRP